MYQRIVAADNARGSSADALAVLLTEKTLKLPEGYAGADRNVGGVISAAIKRAELSLARGSVTTLYPDKGATRVFIVGLGKAEKLDLEAFRIAGAKLCRAATGAKLKSVNVIARPAIGKLDPADVGQAIGEGMMLANQTFDQFKGTAGENGAKKKSAPAGEIKVHVDARLRAAFDRGVKIGESVNLSRRLAMTPPNIATPAYLVSHCRTMARQVGLRCKIIDAKQAAKLKMGGLLAVGAAGSTPPALICLEHKPAKAARQPPIMLVGKAVTFDTGGYSIKPAPGMEAMKYDKCGGMAVIGAMHAIARLKLPVHVVGLIPTAENMVDEKAYRPSDILTLFNGVTVEVTNTDAEGRLILADALAYGCKTYKPQAIVDLATLTGGIIVALGTFCAGCFCGDTKFRSHLFDAAEHTAERLWHMPLWDEHKEMIKGTHGDIVNSANRDAHPIQGAAFLSYFVEQDAQGKPAWAHLDIAGMSDSKADMPLTPKGPTGYGVRLLVRAVETWR